MGDKETRRQRRFNVALPLWVRIRRRLGGRAHSEKKPEVEEETSTTNISSAGCFFYMSEKPPVGARATLEITLPRQPSGMGKRKILCHGNVVRVEDRKVQGMVGVACTIDSYAFESPQRA